MIDKPIRIEAGRYEYHGFTIARDRNIRGCPWVVNGRGLGWQPAYRTILAAWQEIRYWEHTFANGGRLSPSTLKAFTWYWLYGVPYCADCVTGKTPCLSHEEASRAFREAAPSGTRCHCCGKASQAVAAKEASR